MDFNGVSHCDTTGRDSTEAAGRSHMHNELAWMIYLEDRVAKVLTI